MELLNHGNQIINIDNIYNGETVLHTLVKSLDEKKSKTVKLFIQALLDGGASPNLRDKEGLTPLENLLCNQKVSIPFCCTLVTQIITNKTLELPLYLKGLDYLLHNSTDTYQNYDLLVRYFVNMRKDTLIMKLRYYEDTFPEWDRHEMQLKLLWEHIENTENNQKALDALIAMILPNTQDNEELVDIAIRAGSWTTVSALLKVNHIKSLSWNNLLRLTISQTQHLRNCEEYQNCLSTFLELQDDLLLSTDDDMNTPLHYAVQCRNENAIRVLLRAGAPLGIRNKKRQFPIANIDENLLEEHFDYCITDQNLDTDPDPSNLNYTINMNFMNLTKQPQCLHMPPIDYMANTKNLSPLLLHPLIDCFLHIKWQHVNKILTVKFYFHVIFSIVLIADVLLNFPRGTSTSEWAVLPKYLIVVLWCIYYILIMEYLVLSTLIQDALIVVVVEISWLKQHEEIRGVGVATILLMAWKLSTVIGILPFSTVSTHMLMLRKVTVTYLKSLAIYFVFPLSFTLAFYLIYEEPKIGEEPKAFLTFSNMTNSLLRTITLFHGVIDSEQDFTGYCNTIILILFMFLTMVLTNLMNGLAVDDTQVMPIICIYIYFLYISFSIHLHKVDIPILSCFNYNV